MGFNRGRRPSSPLTQAGLKNEVSGYLRKIGKRMGRIHPICPVAWRSVSLWWKRGVRFRNLWRFICARCERTVIRRRNRLMWSTCWKLFNAAGYSTSSPWAGWPFSRNVFGNRPSPQSLNDPKSLYQAPSGTSGECLRHSSSANRSSTVIFRSFARSKRCSRSCVRQIQPLNFRHQLPNVIFASSSRRLLVSTGFVDFWKRSASSKNAFRLCS